MKAEELQGVVGWNWLELDLVNLEVLYIIIMKKINYLESM